MAKINKEGRPSIYTEALGDKICLRVSNGESLKKICKDKKMPCRAIIHKWLLDSEKKEFLDKYKEAVDIRTENMFDNLNEIADISDKNESPNRSRLRIDTRKWYLSKIMPKKYGDKLDLTTDGEKLQIPLIDVTKFQEQQNEDKRANSEI